MRAIPFERLKETLYHEKLPNGLNVYVLPKPGFQKTYATLATKYGSVDNRFRAEGKPEMRVPDGIAHFLEHKMFEEPNRDIFATFAAQGASANAFTSFDRTVYLFSATERIDENLRTLLDFVQNPYFTDENVEKEKGIIGQEINMYRDNPDWRSYFGLIEALYRHHPVRSDIAGTIESIAQITKETLYACYETFYHPSNMSLFVVGGVQPERVLELVRENQAQKTFPPQGRINRYFPEEPDEVNEPKKVMKLPVSLPKCLIGFKESRPGVQGTPLMKRELTTKLALDAVLGPSSALYQQLYDENLISDQFGYEYNCTPDYAFSVIGGETKEPQRLVDSLGEAFKRILAEGIDPVSFERSKRKKIGAFLRMMNSPESIAHEFTKYEFREAQLFDALNVYESITLDDANERLREHVNFARMAVSVVEAPA
jgi:predicted Zn-dependent peptidase